MPVGMMTLGETGAVGTGVSVDQKVATIRPMLAWEYEEKIAF